MPLFSFILACSGPGAEATVRSRDEISGVCAIIGFFLTLQMFKTWFFQRPTGQRGRPLAVAGLLMFLHPALIMNAVQGDCGCLKRNLSYAVTAIFVALVIWQQVLVRRERFGTAPQDQPV